MAGAGVSVSRKKNDELTIARKMFRNVLVFLESDFQNQHTSKWCLHLTQMQKQCRHPYLGSSTEQTSIKLHLSKMHKQLGHNNLKNITALPSRSLHHSNYLKRLCLKLDQY